MSHKHPIDAPLPGDLSQEQTLHRMIRVNHAGEYGAKQIYRGQLAVLGKRPCAPVLQHMADQEEEHLRVFSQMIGQRQVRPTALLPLWHGLGFALGAGTALMGEKAAMACTVAVEEVIDAHYAGQLEALPEGEGELKETIARFREEELEHRDTGLAHGAEEAPAYPVLTEAIKRASRLAIWLSERV